MREGVLDLAKAGYLQRSCCQLIHVPSRVGVPPLLLVDHASGVDERQRWRCNLSGDGLGRKAKISASTSVGLGSCR